VKNIDKEERSLNKRREELINLQEAMIEKENEIRHVERHLWSK
jgi:hypothetical protein